MKHGENGKGIRSRWYAETLKRRILDITAWRARSTFVQGDGIEVMRKHTRKRNAAFFIDPPYTVGGKRAGRLTAEPSNFGNGTLGHTKLLEAVTWPLLLLP